MAINKHVWVRDIKETLFKSNSFAARSIDDTVFVIGGKTVHLPQAGALPAATRNRGSFPATVSDRSDTTVSYDLDSYSSDPTRVSNVEMMEVSYDKRQSVMGNQKNVILEAAYNWLAYYWAPTVDACMVRTSGDARAAFVAGATGNRKKITLKDFISIKRKHDAQGVPSEGRYCLLPSEMYNDLLEIDNVTNKLYTGKDGALAEGAVNRLMGYDIYMRPDVVSYTNAGTPVLRTPDASALTTANAGAIFWHEGFVRRAIGEVDVFYNPKRAEFLGDVMSAEVRAGGRKAYTAETGVVVLIETATP